MSIEKWTEEDNQKVNMMVLPCLDDMVSSEYWNQQDTLARPTMRGYIWAQKKTSLHSFHFYITKVTSKD